MTVAGTPDDDLTDALGPVQQSPDDLMDIHIGELAFKLLTRVKRLKKLQRLHAPQCIIKREKALI